MTEDGAQEIAAPLAAVIRVQFMIVTVEVVAEIGTESKLQIGRSSTAFPTHLFASLATVSVPCICKPAVFGTSISSLHMHKHRPTPACE